MPSFEPQQVFKKPRRLKLKRLIFIILLVLITLLLITFGVFYLYTGMSLPKTNGELRLEGLKEEVNVYRDERGVPHIEAKTESDLFMAQGYITAQDRIFQMEIMRRTASGRMAEVTTQGDSLYMDKLFRTLQLRRMAEESLDILSSETRANLESYSAGINAYIKEATSGFGKLPIEFKIMGFEPEKDWSPVDTLLVGKYLAYMLGDNYRAESYRQHLINQVGEEMATELFPTYPNDGFITVKKSYSTNSDSLQTVNLSRLGQFEFNPVMEGPNQFSPSDNLIGSNGWVVSGKYTKSGKPILANDPHLFVQTPSVWYQTHLILSGNQKRNVIGVTLPGIPGIILGHNESIAWGVTNVQADAQDLFVEKLNPENLKQYEYKGSWKDAEVIKEIIKVKGKRDVELEVLNTVHGPIITEFIGEGNTRSKKNLSLQWTALQPSKEIEAILDLNKANGYEEFKSALSKFHAPALNFFFAGDEGTIAYKMAGLIPIRNQGDGVLPSSGWTGNTDWNGYIPFEQLPETVNPKEGYIVTANNKVTDDSYQYLITKSFAAPYRAQRIADVIEDKKGSLTPQDMIDLQTDTFNLQAKQILPVLLPAIEKTELNGIEKKALTLLENWNYQDQPNLSAPLIYHFWINEFNRLVFEEKMTSFVYERMADKGNVIPKMIVEAALGTENSWIKEAGGFEEVAMNAYRKAVQRAEKNQGNQPEKWTWGKYHRFGPTHMVFGYIPGLNMLFNPEKYPVGGSEVTVGMNAYFEESGVVTYSAPWRQVVDFDDLSRNSKDILASGQSEHFRNDWYDDQLKSHAQGKMYSQHFLYEDYKKFEKLLLIPGN
ncbi:penicillin acylase family protein [Cytobacillus pseudoceanisediminis]|uniref:Penicillin acylase family protein n=1 Tax=Cytobacillus pseudoceanisediminis TaxID=3051614 RepID=A0ABZ2ZLW9_9BACI